MPAILMNQFIVVSNQKVNLILKSAIKFLSFPVSLTLSHPVHFRKLY